jgi:hypothetical protein
MPESFTPGDFIRLKNGPNGSVGVVWQIHSEKDRSVEVAWLESPTRRIFRLHEPDTSS